VPSDSISQQVFRQPAIRPAEYPIDILWTFDDAKADKTVVASPTNPSRPTMRNAIRSTDGRNISTQEWNSIKASARLVIDELFGLPDRGEASSRKTKKYFRTHHSRAWQLALEKLERLQPLLSLCADHWKAEKLIQSKLHKSRGTAIDFSDDADGTSDSDGPMEPSEPTMPRKRLKPQARDPAVIKRAKTSSHIIAPSSTLSTPIATSNHTPSGQDPIDTTYISVEPTVEHLEGKYPFFSCLTLKNFQSDVFRSHEFASIPLAKELMNEMKRDKSVQHGPPSPDILAFIERIESANPNDPNLSVDDNNEGWGHAQFAFGNLKQTLTDWDSIGVDTACRLLAAAIKTCKVARHICHERNISATSYLSDAYLSNVVELLLDAKKKTAATVNNATAIATANTIASNTIDSASTTATISATATFASTAISTIATSLNLPTSADVDPLLLLHKSELQQLVNAAGTGTKTRATKSGAFFFFFFFCGTEQKIWAELIDIIKTFPAEKYPSQDTIDKIISQVWIWSNIKYIFID